MSKKRHRRDGSEIVAGREPSGSRRARVVRRSHPRSLWRRWRTCALAASSLLVVLAAVSAVRYYLVASALSEGRAEVLAARQLLTGDLIHLDGTRVAQAQADLQRAEDDFGNKSQLLRDGWLAQAFSHLPWLSTQVDGAAALRAAGAAGARVGLDVVQLLRDVIPSGSRPTPSSPLQRLAVLASEHPSELSEAAGDIVGLEQSLAAVPRQALFGPLEPARQTVLTEGSKLIASAGPALQLLRAIPAAIGPGTHSYLLLLENPGEERPSGGYIGAVGNVTFTDGAVSALGFRASEDYLPTHFTPAPAPLSRHLFGDHSWNLGDANWSADFPTAMADVERFYTEATGHSVDGVISIDPVALGYVLQVIGPVHVPPYPQVLDASNVLRELNYIINKARPGDPGKIFLPPFGELMTRDLLQAAVGEMPRLAGALQRGAREKHIVMFFHDQGLENLVDGAGFGGRLTTPISDSVFVDDANLSGTKGDLFVTRTMHLSVKVNSNGNAEDQLTLTYSNPSVTNRDDQALLPNSGGGYRDYMRVYLPETAQIVSITASVDGAPPSAVAPEAISYEFNQEAVAYWFVVPAGGTEQITLSYSGPFADISVSPESYRLVWVKQVNALPWPVAVSVAMPSGKETQWSASLVSDQAWATSG